MNRPYVAPRRVTLIGHDHFHQPHMTDMQRERAEPVLQPVRASEPWWVSLGLAWLLVFAFVAMVIGLAMVRG